MDESLSQSLAAVAVLLAAVIAAVEVVQDLRAGVTRMAGATAVRRDHPVAFWFYVSLRGATWAACVWLLATTLVNS